MRTAMILKGLPASAKSTFARDLIKREPNRWFRINRDDLRSMFNSSHYSDENEQIIRDVRDQLILSALKAGKDVIIDDTNLVPKTKKRLHRIFEEFGDVKIIEKAFNVPLEECIRRNALREGVARVPEKAIYGMARASGIDRGKKLEDAEWYYAPKESGEYVPNPALPKAILVDLDGTLAIMGDRTPYDASECDVKDTLNVAVAECVRAMYKSGYKIVFMSGREDKDRAPTERFIKNHLDLPYELFMRATADSRKDSIVKRELFDANVREKFAVVFALDDRNQVVRDCWRAMGVSCFQVAEGNF